MKSFILMTLCEVHPPKYAQTHTLRFVRSLLRCSPNPPMKRAILISLWHIPHSIWGKLVIPAKISDSHLCSPVQSCLKFSAVLYNDVSIVLSPSYTNLGVISLKSSILILPNADSPNATSKKTIGLVVAPAVVIVAIKEALIQ